MHPMPGYKQVLSALSSLSVLLCIGCGSNTTTTICSASPAVAIATSGTNFVLVPRIAALSIYPGGTLSLPIAVAPVGDATGSVTITSANLPQGLTIDPVTTTIGSTAQVNIHAALDVASTCFVGTRDVFEGARNFTLKASDTSGTYSFNFPIDITLENPSFIPTVASGLATVSIDTTNAAPVTSEDDYVDATLTVTDPTNAANNYTGTMGIKGHGNSTWEMPKKAYRLNLDSKTPLLGMTSDSNWIMLANYDDKTMIRDDLANHVSTLFGMFWTPSSVYAEVYLNGQYEGVYEVSEKVEVSKARLNIGSIDDTDNSGADLTGGYLGEMDNYDGEADMITSQVGIPIGLADPDPPTATQAAYFKTAFTAAESALYATNFADPTTGWRSKWNEDSVVQWFLINELMGNVDANDWDSDYFYKPRSDDSFYMGPIWDFDVSSGNVNYSAVNSPNSPWVSTQAKWYVQLFKDPTFLTAVKTMWKANRTAVGEIPTYIDTRTGTLNQAAANNYGRWTTIDQMVWPNSQNSHSYAGEVAYLKSWMTQRIAFMDSRYNQ
jgi:hypothetical protein